MKILQKGKYIYTSILIFFVLFFFSHAVFSATNVSINATVPAICGNGVQEGVEACDDGNTNNGDGCSSLCLAENNNVPPPPPPPVVPPPVVPPPQPDPEPQPDPDPVPPPQPDPVPDQQPNPDPQPQGQDNPDPPQGQNQNQDGGNQAGNEPGQNNAGQDGGGGGAAVPVASNNIFSGATSVVPSNEHIAQSALKFFIGNGSIPVLLQGGSVSTLSGDRPVLAMYEYDLSPRSVDRITLFIKDKQFALFWDDAMRRYSTQFFLPGRGKFDAVVSILYADGAVDSQFFSLIGLGSGQVKESGTNMVVEGATITLLGSGEAVWRGSQENPVLSGSNGSYGFIVPNGEYKLRVEKEGFHTLETSFFLVGNHFIQQELFLIKRTPPLLETLSTQASVSENITAISEKAKEYVAVAGVAVQAAVEKINEVADNPEVEQITEQVVTPVATTVAVATVAPSLWSVVVPLLRFLFLQPLLLFGKRKRKDWGFVYNSLNKLPIDLAVVRLIDKATKKVKQSRVTDLKGRFLFLPEPGEYVLQVVKVGFLFPSRLLSNAKTDGKMVDVYHGEPVVVNEKGVVITPNIPVDPSGEHKTPQRIAKEKRFRIFQQGISFSGILVTLAGLYISPVWYMWVFLALHCMMYGGFLVFVRPRKAKGWGIIYEEGTKKPIANSIIRLFTKEYNKLVSTQTTDKKGRYAFLVGPSNYYVSIEKQGYEPYVSSPIQVQEDGAESELVKKDFALKKKENQEKKT